ncbi:MAG: hypothetical protein MI924_12345 [Chloroflexales bacterium]|nr:hypothetical protein [Chloroflexales bacterium]
MFEYVFEHEPGMYGLTTFEKAWSLADDLALIKPHLPEQLQARCEHILGGDGAAAPAKAEMPLVILNECNATWTFFTREEVISLAPIIRLALANQQTNSIEYEWNDILTAYEQHQYDWVAFIYPFA